MSDPFFFGYGSLVNVRTHDYPETAPATLNGWRRSWRHTTLRPHPFLSVVPDTGTTISGLIARVPDDDWAALDARERGYQRLRLQDTQITHTHQTATDVQVYQTHDHLEVTTQEAFPILLSYLDVVVQGFLQIFGEDGVTEFFSTTEGWEAPVLNDRTAPIYSRHQRLTQAERDLVDHHLAGLPARMKKL